MAIKKKKKSAVKPAKAATKKRENKDEVFYIKATKTEKKKVEVLSDDYFKGNTSALVRFCVFNWDFKKNPPPIM